MKSLILNYKKLIYGIIGTIWLLTTFIGYYYTHKPFASEEFLNFIVIVWQIAIVLSIFSLAGGVGFWLLRGCPDQALSLTTIQAALGLGIVSIVHIVTRNVG